MKISYVLLAGLSTVQAGAKFRVRRQMTTSTESTTTLSTTSQFSTASTGTIVTGTGFSAQIQGQWHEPTTGLNFNVFLNGDGTALILEMDNPNSLVLGTQTAVIDDVAMTITLENGAVGSIQADGTVLFSDGTSWAAGLAALNTTTGAPTTTTAGGGSGYNPGMNTTMAMNTTVDAGAGAGSGYNPATTTAGAGAGAGSGYNPATTAAPAAGGGAVDPYAPSEGGDSGNTDPYAPSGSGSISGDPHVVLQYPGQEKLCYDIHGDNLDFVSLLYDINTQLEINGRLTHVKDNKSRLSAVGFKTPAGVEIGVFPDRVTVGYMGKIDNTYDYEEYMKIETEDATVEILSLEESKHKGVKVAMNSGNLFHIEDKDFKESLRLEILKSAGMSGRMSGVMGQVLQPKDYQINMDTSVSVEDRYIEQTHWDSHSKCFRIKDWDVRNFLGHTVYDYEVKGLFSTMDQAWLDIQLAYERSPK